MPLRNKFVYIQKDRTQARAIAVPVRATPHDLIGLRDLAKWVAGWPDGMHLTIALCTASTAVMTTSGAPVQVQMGIAAGLFVMAARLLSRVFP